MKLYLKILLKIPYRLILNLYDYKILLVHLILLRKGHNFSVCSLSLFKLCLPFKTWKKVPSAWKRKIEMRLLKMRLLKMSLFVMQRRLMEVHKSVGSLILFFTLSEMFWSFSCNDFIVGFLFSSVMQLTIFR